MSGFTPINAPAERSSARSDVPRGASIIAGDFARARAQAPRALAPRRTRSPSPAPATSEPPAQSAADETEGDAAALSRLREEGFTGTMSAADAAACADALDEESEDWEDGGSDEMLTDSPSPQSPRRSPHSSVGPAVDQDEEHSDVPMPFESGPALDQSTSRRLIPGSAGDTSSGLYHFPQLPSAQYRIAEFSKS
jgi:hypothetical protein